MNKSIKKVTLSVGEKLSQDARPDSETISIYNFRNRGDEHFGFGEVQLEFKDYPELNNIVLFLSVELADE